MTHKQKVAGKVNWFCGHHLTSQQIPQELQTPEFAIAFKEAQDYLELAKEILKENYKVWAEENE